MFGHGRPFPGRLSLDRHAGRGHPRLARWLALALVCGAALSARAAELDLRLRITWGGPRARHYVGSIALSAGELSAVVPLSTAVDAHRAVGLVEGVIRIEPTTPAEHVGVDVSLRAPEDAELLIDLHPSDAPNPAPRRIPLRSLVSEAYAAPLEADTTQLRVTRAPGDLLRVNWNHATAIVRPGEPLRFQVTSQFLAPAGGRHRLRVDLAEARGAKPLMSSEFDASLTDAEQPAREIPVELQAPAAEGVYEIQLRLSAKRLGLRPLAGVLAERRWQFVVLDPELPSPATAGRQFDRVVEEIDPANPNGLRRFAQLPLIRALPRGPLGVGDAHAWPSPLGKLIQLGPGGTEANVSWEAYPLPVQRAGVPHLLEVDYPINVPQHMGISIIEPDAAGAVRPVGVDSGLYVADEDAAAAAQLATHRLVFWPRTRTPLVLITNRRDGSRAVYGKLRVRAGPTHLAPLLDSQETAQGRLVAAFLERPWFHRQLAASDVRDEATERAVDDWRTFYEASSRLVEYLEFAGYNGLMLCVAADGNTLYPSVLGPSTPHFDTASLATNQADPLVNDRLELIARLFDRRQLRLVPTLDFAAPLPALEDLRRSNSPDRVGLEWTDTAGRPASARPSLLASGFPCYNILHPAVQQSLLAAVTEVIQRYATHPCWAGVGLQLSADTLLQLPAAEWGFDDATIAQFARDTGLELPSDAGPERFARRAEVLLGPERSAWEAWRRERLAAFHRRLLNAVAAAGSNAPLYIVPTSVVESKVARQELLPALPRRASLEGLFEALGLPAQTLAEPTPLALLRPQRLSPPQTLAPAAVDLQVNQPSALDRLLSGTPTAAALLYHPPQTLRVPTFDAKSPFRPTQVVLHSQPTASQSRQRREWAHALARLDARQIFAGGLTLTLGQEESLAPFLRAFRRLPSVPFQALPSESQPIVVRTYAAPRQLFAYAVNDSPWPATLALDIAAPPGTQLVSLDHERPLPPLELVSGRADWQLPLEPYELVAFVFSDPRTRLSQPKATIDPEIASSLAQRIHDLKQRVNSLALAQPIESLTNPGFELPAEAPQQIPGWQLAASQGATAEPVDSLPHVGQQSLRFHSAGPVAGLVSDPFPAPPTGRLSIVVWLRIADVTQQPPFRLALQGSYRGRDYYRYKAVGRGREHQLQSEWRAYRFHVDDLPLDGLTELRARFDLMGAGEVWIDDVEVSALDFSESELRELQLLTYDAHVRLQDAQVSDCLELLGSYWPRFLFDYVPLTQERLARDPRPAVALPPAAAPGTPTPDEPAPAGIFETLRRRLWWR